jgi:ubiquinone biosynthesis protein UbiJ
VQLAAEVNWLTQHVRWDIEEDVARIVGDAPAHMLGKAARAAVSALKGLVQRRGVAA